MGEHVIQNFRAENVNHTHSATSRTSRGKFTLSTTNKTPLKKKQMIMCCYLEVTSKSLFCCSYIVYFRLLLWDFYIVGGGGGGGGGVCLIKHINLNDVDF